jgi:hypothetical protein
MTLEGEHQSLWIGSLAKTLVQDDSLLKDYIEHRFGNYVVKYLLESAVGDVHVGAICKLVLLYLTQWADNKHCGCVISLCCLKGDCDFLESMRDKWELELDCKSTLGENAFVVRGSLISQLRRKCLRKMESKHCQTLQPSRSKALRL